MKYRKLGNNNDLVSVIGYGTMRLPILNNSPGNIDEPKAIEQIRYGIDRGINYVDTAYPYHMGNSELVVGKALKDGYREKVFLADKMPTWLIKEPSDMDNYLDKQLEKLDTDYIDFYLIHTLDQKKWDNCLKNNLFEFIDRAKKSGKIKQIGFSFHDEVSLFKEIIDKYNWDFCQIQLNFMDEDFQAGLEGLKYAGDKNIDVIIMEPLRGGTLANNIPENIGNIWKSLGKDRSAAGWALQYLWNYKEISTVLSGMNSIDQIDDNVSEASKSESDSLSKKEHDAINEVKKIYKNRALIDCTKCNYCMPCPNGVDIPGCFEIYNNANIYNNLDYYRNQYQIFMSEDERASNCIECGLCEDACPQNLEIIALLKQVRIKLGD
ncbi:MAG: aldo/keto reductase [Peptostreptococcaceae bacterium]|nr:aldo/keto reductase [Peptostreptococcaceae bacterium]